MRGKWNGLTAWWGAFANKDEAEELANGVDGEVVHETELKNYKEQENND